MKITINEANESFQDASENKVEKIFQISNDKKNGEDLKDPNSALNSNIEPREPHVKLGKRSYSQSGTDLFNNKKQRKDKEFDKKSEEFVIGSDYEVGDCLMSVKGNDLDDNYQSSDDQD